MPAYTRNPQDIPDDSVGGSTVRQGVKDQNSKSIDQLFVDINAHANNEEGKTHVQIDQEIDQLRVDLDNTTANIVPDAETARDAALVAKTGAETAKTGAETAQAKAGEWAEKAEDSPVEVNAYSAKHWAAKAQKGVESLNATGVYRNKVINGNFAINQRGVNGTVVLEAGKYGHDMWKAGSAGCTYTFVTVGNTTTITISAGSLVQVINGKQIDAGTHSLSWIGTVQFKIDGGVAGDSGMTEAATEGNSVTIETSGTGTVTNVQLEKGSIVTPFENPGEDQGLSRCQSRHRTFLGGHLVHMNRDGAASRWWEMSFAEMETVPTALIGSHTFSSAPTITAYKDRVTVNGNATAAGNSASFTDLILTCNV